MSTEPATAWLDDRRNAWPASGEGGGPTWLRTKHTVWWMAMRRARCEKNTGGQAFGHGQTPKGPLRTAAWPTCLACFGGAGWPVLFPSFLLTPRHVAGCLTVALSIPSGSVPDVSTLSPTPMLPSPRPLSMAAAALPSGLSAPLPYDLFAPTTKRPPRPTSRTASRPDVALRRACVRAPRDYTLRTTRRSEFPSAWRACAVVLFFCDHRPRRRSAPVPPANNSTHTASKPQQAGRRRTGTPPKG